METLKLMSYFSISMWIIGMSMMVMKDMVDISCEINFLGIMGLLSFDSRVGVFRVLCVL